MQLSRLRSPLGPRGALVLAALIAIPVAPALAATLDRIRESGSVKLGYLVDARPFSYRDESGKPAGYAIELCEAIADAAKTELRLPQLRSEFVPVGFEERFDAVRPGRIDLLCAAGTVTLGRREQVDFSIPVFPGGVGALMRRDAPERLREILSGKPEPERPAWRASLGQILQQRTFAVQRGTTTETWAAERIGELGVIAKIDPVDAHAVGVERVVARKADVLFGERSMLLDAAARSPAAGELMVVDRHFTYEPLALALERGDEDFRLLVDRTLSRLYRSGKIHELYTPSFGEPGEEAQRFFERNGLPE